MDYRSVNKDTIPDRYPLPCVDELIDAIGARKTVYFTTLDLTRGYHQVKMAEESKEKLHLCVIVACTNFVECRLV